MDETEILREKLKDYEKIIQLSLDLFSSVATDQYEKELKLFSELLEKHNLKAKNENIDIKLFE